MLRKHWPEAIIYDDVTTIDWSTVPRVDILTGGFPCQDISNAGKRKGIEGERSGLWKYYLEAIRILRPKYAVIENVSALLNRGLDVVLSDLAQIGYDTEWDCLPASSVGAPHRRDRVFIIAYSNNGQRKDEQVQAGRYTSEAGSDDLADSNGKRSLHRQSVEQSESGGGRQAQPQLVNSSHEIPNADSSRLEGEFPEGRQLARFREKIGRAQWEVEPNVGRLASRISPGLANYLWRERIKALGNSVVPQVAQFIGERIKQAEEARGGL